MESLVYHQNLRENGKKNVKMKSLVYRQDLYENVKKGENVELSVPPWKREKKREN